MLMRERNQGLTTLYNCFNDPCDDSIQKLRELHSDMDRAVLDSYGWTDIQPKCEFIPEFDEEDDEDGGGRPKKKQYRYRWPDDVGDEVLARLLELNRQRALEEGQLLAAEVDAQPIDGKKKKPAKKKSSEKTEQPTPDLFTAGKGDA